MKKIILILIFSLYFINYSQAEWTTQDELELVKMQSEETLNAINDQFINNREDGNRLEKGSPEYKQYEGYLKDTREAYNEQIKALENKVKAEKGITTDSIEGNIVKDTEKKKGRDSTNTGSAPTADNQTTSSSNGIEVKVTEKITGANCIGSAGAYVCTVKPGFGSVMDLMGGIIKYFTYLRALGGILFIVINGVMLSMSGLGGEDKGAIKKKIMMTIGGLILLLLSGLILHSIAPWIYQ